MNLAIKLLRVRKAAARMPEEIQPRGRLPQKLVLLVNALLAFCPDVNAADALVGVQFQSSAYSVSEHANHLLLSITLTNRPDPAWQGTVEYFTTDGTARSPQDYKAQHGQLQFTGYWQDPPIKFVSIPVYDNRLVDGNRTFSVTLSNASPGLEIVSPATVTITILDDDNYAGPAYGINDEVLCSAVQSDGKIMVGGIFTTVDGYRRNSVARLLPDLSCDSSFNPGAGADRPVVTLVQQPDGKTLVGGPFVFFDGQPLYGIARINIDGSCDTNFSTGGGFAGIDPPGASVAALSVDLDGNILVGGNFTNFNGRPCPGLVRLKRSGSLDQDFIPDFHSSGFLGVRAIAVLPNGKILVGGQFNYFDYMTAGSTIVRLNSDGTLDPGFSSVTGLVTVYCLAVLADGKILVAGNEGGLVRLNPDGSMDNSFSRGLLVGITWVDYISTMAVSASGKIFVGGWEGCAGSPVDGACRGLLRVNSDGTLDDSFQLTEGYRHVSTVALHNGNLIFIGGKLGSPESCYAENLNFDGSVFENLEFLPLVRRVDGSVHVRLKGQSALDHYALQLSNNLHDWSTVFTNLFPRLGAGFIDTNAIALQQRFYRVAP